MSWQADKRSEFPSTLRTFTPLCNGDSFLTFVFDLVISRRWMMFVLSCLSPDRLQFSFASLNSVTLSLSEEVDDRLPRTKFQIRGDCMYYIDIVLYPVSIIYIALRLIVEYFFMALGSCFCASTQEVKSLPKCIRTVDYIDSLLPYHRRFHSVRYQRTRHNNHPYPFTHRRKEWRLETQSEWEKNIMNGATSTSF